MVIRADFDFESGTGSRRRKPDTEPLRCLVFAALSDQAHDKKEFFAQPVRIDEFDALVRRLAPSFTDPNCADGGDKPRYSLSSLEDFHPDALAAAVASLAELVELRKAIDDPAHRNSALARLAALTGEAGPEPEGATESDPAPPPEGEDQMFERLLGQSRRDESESRAKQTVDALIRQALGAKTQTGQAPQTQAAAETLDHLFQERLRTLLTDPHFRSLERAWRSLHWLVSRLEDDQARVYVVDVGKATLAAHLSEFGGRLEESPLHGLVVDDDKGWDLLVGDYTFDLDTNDIVMLAAMGALASQAQAPFLSHGQLSLAGCREDSAIEEPWNWSVQEDEAGELWDELRRHPASGWIGLALPRFILRYPYGLKNDPIEDSAFEELPARPSRDRFLWGNPAFVCALLLCQTRANDALEWPHAVGGDVLDLPAPIYDDGTGSAMQPPLEFLLGERARSIANQSGLIVFAGGSNTNRIATAAISSLAANSA